MLFSLLSCLVEPSTIFPAKRLGPTYHFFNLLLSVGIMYLIFIVLHLDNECQVNEPQLYKLKTASLG